MRRNPSQNDSSPSSSPAITGWSLTTALLERHVYIIVDPGEDRQFAERCLAEHPAPTEEEIAAADTALKPYLAQLKSTFEPHPFPMILATLGIYVCIPAWIAALLFQRRADVANGGRDFRPVGRQAGIPLARFGGPLWRGAHCGWHCSA